MRRTGEHEVVDDGAKTLIMPSVDPAALGLDAGMSNPGISTGALEAASGDAIPSGDAGDPEGDYASYSREESAGGGDDGDGEPETAAAGTPADAKPPEGNDKPPAKRGWFRRKNKRR